MVRPHHLRVVRVQNGHRRHMRREANFSDIGCGAGRLGYKHVGHGAVGRASCQSFDEGSRSFILDSPVQAVGEIQP